MLGLGNTVLSDYKTVFLDDYSLLLDGTDQYVDCDTIVSNIDPDEGSISLWAKVNETTSTGNIFRMQVDANNFISIIYHAGSNETRATYKGGGTAVTAVTTAAIEADDNWHHIVITWSVVAKKLRLYLDSSHIQASPSSGNLPTFAGSINTADIGQDTAGNAYFSGYINDVVIFNESISVANVTEIYNSGKPNDVGLQSPGSALIAYFKFEDSQTKTIAIDSSSNKTDGTVVNVPTWSTDTP